MNEDGYTDMWTKKNRPTWKKYLWDPLVRLTKKTKLVGSRRYCEQPGNLILVRHGESLWNANKTFTGWADPDLSSQGYREIEHAARLLLAGGYEIDVVFTSRLKRAIRSTWLLLQELNQVHLPVFKSWRLNERMYGALTGLSKKETAERLGAEIVQQWRGSLKSRPPPLQTTDEFWPGRDRRYFDLDFKQIPLTESLLDCMKRTDVLWSDKITRELSQGRNVLVVAHANTLRGLVKIIDDIGDNEIQEVSIPTGIPIVYKFDKHLKPIRFKGERQTACQIHMSGIFLEKPGMLKEALKREEEWINLVPGYDYTMSRYKRPMTQLERSLNKLKAERELGEWAGQFVDPSAVEEDDGSDGNNGRPMSFVVEDDVWEKGVHDIEEGRVFDPDETAFHETSPPPIATTSEVTTITTTTTTPLSSSNIISTTPPPPPCNVPLPAPAIIAGLGHIPIRRDSAIVIIRHGKTEHNKLGLFTGWEDAPLAPEGIDEAKAAGRLLRKHGFEFDVVYTSWLSRAIETAWYVLDELDSIWLPIVKSWRLNERMYGSLTGLSKQMVRQKYGEGQFKAWRRGYKVRPPMVSSFSPLYPGNDQRYNKYLNDVGWSWRESLIRTIESGKFVKRRKLPKAESLKDCMDRTIPYFAYQIVPEAIASGKRVLISSSENAIRGLLMYLCDIPEEEITGLEIPNGVPLIFDVKRRCLKLLDDGSGRDPLEVYDFGSAASYLFTPCENEDGSIDEECDINYMSQYYQEDDSINETLSLIKGGRKKDKITTENEYVGIPMTVQSPTKQNNDTAVAVAAAAAAAAVAAVSGSTPTTMTHHEEYMGMPMTNSQRKN